MTHSDDTNDGTNDFFVGVTVGAVLVLAAMSAVLVYSVVMYGGGCQ